MDKYIEGFLGYLKGKNRAKLTLEKYNKECNDFVKFINKTFNIELNQVKRKHIQEYQTHLSNIGMSASTQENKLLILKSFFKWLTKYEEMFQENPIKDVELPKVGKRLPKQFTTEQSKLLMDSIESRNYIRDKAIVTMFLLCGLRREEMISLNLENVIGNKLRIIGKGNKEREINMTDGVMNALNDYLKIRPRVNTNALFLSERKERMKKENINYLISKFEKKAGLPTGVHILRHTFATLMHEAGEDIMTLKAILGHENLETTQIYTEVTSKRIAKAMEAHPLNAII